ncbi:MAG: Hpt domain-containing protein [Lachnospiraceae bacterium]|nr:Hpt domain-containing protein [Lachnospiraceae bacterium]
MNKEFSDLKEAGFDIEAGIRYTGSRDNYYYMLKRYYDNANPASDAISDCLVRGDLSSYMRAVHSLKSNSRMIGANDLSEMAEELEYMAKAEDKAGVLEKTPALLGKLAEVCGYLKPYGGSEAVSEQRDLAAKDALRIGREILNALEELDDKKATELTKQLMGYPFGRRQKNLLKSALDDIADYSYDDAAEQVLEAIREVDEQV